MTALLFPTRVRAAGVLATAALLYFGFSLLGRAGAQAPTAAEVAAPTVPAQAGPEPVTVGVFVNQVHEFSLHDNSFTVDFYVWFRWKNPELKPYETFSVVDGRLESKTEAIVKDLPGGEKYAWVRVVAKITRFFDTTAYPLDNHNLSITIEEEESETHLIVYQADVANSAASPDIRLSGWTFTRLNTVAGERQYRSNFGDTSLPTGNQTRYARVTTAVSFTREGSTFFFKLFFALWVCVAVAFLAFFIKPTDVDPRFGLGVGALFAAIASQYVVTSGLPDSNVITLADRLHLIAFFFIFLSIAQSTWSLWLMQTDRPAPSLRFDRISRVVAPVAYFLANVIAVASV